MYDYVHWVFGIFENNISRRKSVQLYLIVSYLHYRPLVFYSKDTNGWCVPFVGSDRSVVMRSQRYNYEVRKERPVSELFMCICVCVCVCPCVHVCVCVCACVSICIQIELEGDIL